MQGGSKVRVFELGCYQPGFYSADLSPDGHILATGGSNGEVTLWNMSSGPANAAPVGSWISHAGFTSLVRWSGSGDLLLVEGYLRSVSRDTVKVWDIDGNLVAEHPLGRENCPQSFWKPGEDTMMVFRSDGLIEYVCDRLAEKGGMNQSHAAEGFWASRDRKNPP